MRDDERDDAPSGEAPEEPAAEPVSEDPAAGQPAGADEPTHAGEPSQAGEAAQSDEAGQAGEAAQAEEAEEAPEAEGEPPTGPPLTERPPADVRRPVRERGQAESAEEVIPGAHLEPDLVLESPSEVEGEEGEYARYVEAEEPDAAAAPAPVEEEPETSSEPPTRGPLDLAGDARYRATGKRKTSVARVILRPGSGSYTLNGRPLEEFFPRPALQKRAREALEVVGYASRMDVVARLHGGGVSSQAGALRHGIARALVEADPNLRRDLKRRGFLTRDAREKERRKAGLKKARKRPQFSKR
jgi:small subunit ribosomal protein S9